MFVDLEKRALNFCIKNKHRYTKPRENVLKIIAKSNKPLKAYDVLKQLALVLKDPKPPTAYRAIDFWLKYNFIHRIESLNAFTACSTDHLHNGSQFMICDDCGKVIESHLCELPLPFKDKTKKVSFIPKKWNLEINGTCKNCV